MKYGLLADIPESEDCLASHIEPYRDPFDIFDLWSFEEQPYRLMIHGHHYKWIARTPTERVDWSGSTPLTLDPHNRYLIQVAAVCEGRCAVLDTSANILHSIQLRTEDLTRGSF